MHQIDLPSPGATKDLAARITRCLRIGDIVALRGPLGVGKTTLARHVIKALGWTESEIPSPTFTLAQLYDLPDFTLWHFDLYRLDKPEDAFELGIEDAFATGVSLIEWPERLGDYLPTGRLDITLSFKADDDARQVDLDGDPSWSDRLDELCNG
ncbi:MAG: tRNA (adenosine(37)-N6)-threonylcarbamoyltransferase complex ATPase subunit type 1 TsaE [Rhodospirillaceae bacterium]|jgi:tRNA threonylcarbamoyladenosine biosynthesis protein TsaE|nr:tRNA (adenosine(37)-N6)-threonylcarbamoyltransferase complex ATPase subunit type 1 TsaE [Rhodospirillaceae bacterium]MBT5666557.1 tRNA (adenosine(37)-N6)-threonylcarbamoyltransferase complex ATPase subunit type 1 TsaE [Rhodospirillaceae bacterium]MBT5809934.1 tRNA (adenosine(37)-N6)-threonylcarbamoyltransferase complex ATPase subunit type 1 TsaE [Rhodospirillaceae bacterium]